MAKYGGRAPYAATTITLTEDVLFQNQLVPAGQYALFCIPEKDQWTIILNKTVNQWGAYRYDAANDQLRIKVKPVALTTTVESFTIQFANVSTLAADLRLSGTAHRYRYTLPLTTMPVYWQTSIAS